MLDVAILIGGNRYQDLTSCTLRSTIDEVTQTFEASYVQSIESASQRIRIDEGTQVEVEVDGDLFLTGFVDDSIESHDAHTHRWSISGRARTSDLCDCTAIYKGSRIYGKSILKIAELLCKPFGISVTIDRTLVTDLELSETVANFKLDEGETVFEALSQLTRKFGLVIQTTPAGDLLLTRATRLPSGSLIRSGVNIESATYTGTWRDRFSLYTFKAQMRADDNWHGASANQIKHVVTDPAVKRYRPIVISPEHHDTVAKIKRRATWERNIRAGKSQQITCVIDGWSGLSGIWKPNTMPRFTDTVLGVDSNLLITSSELYQDQKGKQTATLQLADRAAYDVLDEPKVRRGKR
jgi:prophage tail gpP-like protein